MNVVGDTCIRPIFPSLSQGGFLLRYKREAFCLDIASEDFNGFALARLLKSLSGLSLIVELLTTGPVMNEPIQPGGIRILSSVLRNKMIGFTIMHRLGGFSTRDLDLLVRFISGSC